MNSNLLRLRYKGCEIGFNPKSLKITKSKNNINHFSPSSGSIIQELGFNAATVEGSGEFYGPSARKQYDELYSLFKLSDSGILHISGQKPFYAYFSSISRYEQESANVINYSFKFVEDCKKGGGRT